MTVTSGSSAWMPRRGMPCGRSSCGTRRNPSPRGLWPCAPRIGASTSFIRTTATRTFPRSSTTPSRTASPPTMTMPPSAPSPVPSTPPASPIATSSPKTPSASPPNSTTTPSPSSTTTTATTTPKMEGGREEICVKLITNIVFWGIMGIPREIFLDYMMKSSLLFYFWRFLSNGILGGRS